VKPIVLPASYNYIAAFLTLRCNLRCSYCINRYETGREEEKRMGVADWIRALDRIESRPDLPVTLQGGEPTLHRGFFTIVNEVKPELNIDLLTNGRFGMESFMWHVSEDRMKRDAPYASIRFSYHPHQMDLYSLVFKVSVMKERGYSVGIWMVDVPGNKKYKEQAQAMCKNAGIDFRLKEYLSETFGTYKWPEAISKKVRKKVYCKTTELIIGPDGSVYKCHADLYENRKPIGNITDESFMCLDVWRECENFGHCNPCDIKVKNNRFQQYGHTSVDIREDNPYE
jgi:MoaA/NifB/PqqE/SkfB family radical SAM enzyme